MQDLLHKNKTAPEVQGRLNPFAGDSRIAK